MCRLLNWHEASGLRADDVNLGDQKTQLRNKRIDSPLRNLKDVNLSQKLSVVETIDSAAKQSTTQRKVCHIFQSFWTLMTDGNNVLISYVIDCRWIK